MFKSLKWKDYKDHCILKRCTEVYCGRARIALIVWRPYKKSKFNGYHSVYLYFEGSCEHAIPSNQIKYAKLFVKDQWKKFKKEITK